MNKEDLQAKLLQRAELVAQIETLESLIEEYSQKYKFESQFCINKDNFTKAFKTMEINLKKNEEKKILNFKNIEEIQRKINNLEENYRFIKENKLKTIQFKKEKVEKEFSNIENFLTLKLEEIEIFDLNSIILAGNDEIFERVKIINKIL